MTAIRIEPSLFSGKDRPGMATPQVKFSRSLSMLRLYSKSTKKKNRSSSQPHSSVILAISKGVFTWGYKIKQTTRRHRIKTDNLIETSTRRREV
jgi:hypothetical protein